jgi:pimeloyl-ACP methyl ester carboxylesterase
MWAARLLAASSFGHTITRIRWVAMATYVLVHGGGHGGWCYQPVARLLRARGHEVYTPTLTGLGERQHLLSPAVDLDIHITDVVKVLEFEDLRDVILVGHSYGGMVITGVADRTPERIGTLVYLDAAYPQNGQSLVDVAGPVILASRETGRVVDGMELVLYPGKDPMNFYGVTDPEQIAWMEPKLTPHPWKCFEQKLVLDDEATMRKIPQSFIACSFHMDDQARAALQALSAGRYWEIDTGHDLMITEPRAVAEALLELASRQERKA